MAESSLKRFAPIAVALGVGGLLVAAGVYLVQRQFSSYVQAALAIGLLGLALAVLFNPGAVQRWLMGRQARYGGNVLLMVLALFGILLAVNYLVDKNPKRWDWTEDKTNTLAPETINVLKALPQPARAVGFYSSQFVSSQDSAEELLERYRAESGGKFAFEFHDPLAEPGVARQYGVTRDGTLIIEMGEQREETSFASEEEVTGALFRLSNPTQRTLYFTTGHGEHELEGGGEDSLTRVADLLKKQNYVLQTINLQVTATVPSDARALVVAGPLVPLTAEEVGAIKAYVDGGGSLVVMQDPAVDVFRNVESLDPNAPEPLADYLRTDWGLDLRRDLVLDLEYSQSNYPIILFAAQYGSSPITERLQNISTVFPGARSVGVAGDPAARPDLTATPLIMTSASGWGESDIAGMLSGGSPAQDAADTPAPLNLAVAVENTTTKGRLVVFGDSDFASNRTSNEGQNANLFTNTLNWVTVEEDLINLAPRLPTTRTMEPVNSLVTNLIILITVLVLPLAVVVLGGVVWFQRRRHV